MCYVIQPMWRKFVKPASCCSRQLYTASVVSWYSRPRMSARQSAKYLSNFHCRQTRDIVRSLLHSSGLSTTASCELGRFLQQDCCCDNVLSVASQSVTLSTSRSLSCNQTKTVRQQNQNQLSFYQLRHYIPRQLTSSTKTLVDASPLSLQPYLRLIRFDRPIGITTSPVAVLLAIQYSSGCYFHLKAVRKANVVAVFH